MTMNSGSTLGTDPGLDLPWYGIGFGPAVARFFKKYAKFSGRASRGEYWWAYLFNTIIACVFMVLLLAFGVDWAAGTSYYGSYEAPFTAFGAMLYVVWMLVLLAILVPTLAVAVRRLHDIGKSGGWWFVSLIPFVGGIWFIILMATPTNHSPNQWDYPSGYAPTMPYAPYAPGTPYASQGYPPASQTPYPPATPYQPAPNQPPSPYPPMAPNQPPAYPPTAPSQPPSPYPPSPGTYQSPYDPNLGSR